MKKMKWIGIILLIIIICGIGLFIRSNLINNAVASNGAKATETNTKNTKTLVENDKNKANNIVDTKNTEDLKSINTQNTNAQSKNELNDTQNATAQNKKVQNNIQNTVAQSNRAQKSNNHNVENQGTIVYTVPNGSYSENTVLVKNTTGRDISSGLLNEYLRSWIMEGQNGCEGICDATGTLWEKLWLDKVPDETIINAFIDANGEAALSQNITAKEFIKATQQLDLLTINNVPFTLAQAKPIILNMLQQDGYATPSEVTKIVFVQGAPSVYEVYTKQSGNYIFWTVDANTGYAHG